MCDQLRPRPACAYVQSDQSLCLSLEYSMTVKLLTEYHVELLSLKGGCTGSSESTLVKIPNCCRSLATAHILTINMEIVNAISAFYNHSFAIETLFLTIKTRFIYINQ